MKYENKKKIKKDASSKEKLKKRNAIIKEKELEKIRLENIELEKKKKKFVLFFSIFIIIFAGSLVIKGFQNDTFYTIEIGESILEYGIDMKDHFSFHENLPYTYPHWLYDLFIYLCYAFGGYTGIYISSIILFVILVALVFKINRTLTNNCSTSAFATFICALAIGRFATARAQLLSFLLFALEIYFIESFLKNKKKRYLFGLLILSILICNIHLAVWPFYFILYLPYLAEYIVSLVVSKIKIRKENKFINYLKKKVVLERNENVKYLFFTMILSLVTGLITPLHGTPYTYPFRMSMSNAEEYVLEHQSLGWAQSPFTIIIAFETLFLSLISRVKLRDFFMICGLVLMAVVSVRHLSLLALIGTICFARLFTMFFESNGFDVDKKVINFFTKRCVAIISCLIAIVGIVVIVYFQQQKEFIDDEFYPVEAVKYIKENIDIDKMRIFNEYNFGSYLLHHDIPVFIDSRAELYTSAYNGLEYDIFDDYHYMPSIYKDKFEFYGITHVLLYKEYKEGTNPLYTLLSKDINYKLLYEDDFFVFYEKIGKNDIVITYN